MSSTPTAPANGGDAAGRVPGEAAGTAPAGRRGRWARQVPRAALLALLLFGTAGCQNNALTRLGMPPPVTNQGKVVLSLWQGSWIAALAVGVVVWGLILWAVVFHRQRDRTQVPQQVRYNLPIEMLYTVVPFIMIGILFYFTARDENYINRVPPRPDVKVNVIGLQWKWQFRYPQYKVPGSATKYVTMNGQPWSPAYGDSQLPVLEIPEHRTVQFNLISLDVVHAFWIVPFEFKRDVIPGHPNSFTVTPNHTLYSGPDSIGRCTELCGLYHSRMLFRVRIVTPAQFRTWIHAQQVAQTKAAGSTP